MHGGGSCDFLFLWRSIFFRTREVFLAKTQNTPPPKKGRLGRGPSENKNHRLYQSHPQPSQNCSPVLGTIHTDYKNFDPQNGTAAVKRSTVVIEKTRKRAPRNDRTTVVRTQRPLYGNPCRAALPFQGTNYLELESDSAKGQTMVR